MNYKLLNILSFMAMVQAITVLAESQNNDHAQDEKYAKDTGVTRSVISYILGGAGCLVILGVIFFAYCKYKRGERVLFMQKTRPAESGRVADVEMNPIPAEEQPAYGRTRTVQSLYGTSNPYGWPAHATLENTGRAYVTSDLNKPLPRRPMHGHGQREHAVQMPAPVARPVHLIPRVPVPGRTLPVIHPDHTGYYNAA